MKFFGKILVAREIKPLVLRLEQVGISATSTPIFGGPSYVASFKKGSAGFQIVKDRGYWFLDGEEEALKRSPSRGSLAEVLSDALEWAKKKNA